MKLFLLKIIKVKSLGSLQNFHEIISSLVTHKDKVIL